MAVIALLFLQEAEYPESTANSLRGLRELRAEGRLEEALEVAQQLRTAHPGAEWAARERGLCLLYLEFYQYSFRQHAPWNEDSEDGFVLEAIGELSSASRLAHIVGVGYFRSPGRDFVENLLESGRPGHQQGAGLRRQLLLALALQEGLENLPGAAARLYCAEHLANQERFDEARLQLLLSGAWPEPILEEVRKTCLELLEEPGSLGHKGWATGGSKLVCRAWRLAQSRNLRTTGQWRRHPLALHVQQTLGPIVKVLRCPGEPPLVLLKVETPPFVRWVTLGMSWHYCAGRPTYPVYPRELMVTVAEDDAEWPVGLLKKLARSPQVYDDPDLELLPVADVSPILANSGYAGVYFSESLSAPEKFNRTTTDYGLVQAVYLLCEQEVSVVQRGYEGRKSIAQEFRDTGRLDVVRRQNSSSPGPAPSNT